MLRNLLVTTGKKCFMDSGQTVDFLKNKEQNNFLNDLKNNPHAFVLGCLMDRRIKTERAWEIPVKIKQLLGSFSIDFLASISLEEYTSIFEKNSLHYYNPTMAKVFYSGVIRIQDKYAGDVSTIWCNTPSSAKVVYEFLQFEGCGIKISTMAANILARQFKIHFSDYYSIDISPDVHIKRVMCRSGLVELNASNEEIIYKARELNPEFPGIIDFSCWEIGRKWCKSSKPLCSECILNTYCGKHI